MKIEETMKREADTNMGLLRMSIYDQVRQDNGISHPLANPAEEGSPAAVVVAILIIGARRPVTRLNAEQRASPVPL